jgi:hypothetical protein
LRFGWSTCKLYHNLAAQSPTADRTAKPPICEVGGFSHTERISNFGFDTHGGLGNPGGFRSFKCGKRIFKFEDRLLAQVSDSRRFFARSLTGDMADI